MKLVYTFLCALMLPVFAFADTVVLPAPAADPTMDFLQSLLASINGAKGAGALVIVGIAVKLLLKAMDLPIVANLLGSKFKDMAGGVKLTIVLLLSYIAGVVGLMVPPTSLTLGAALVHSTTLTAFMVLSNQIYKQWIAKDPKDVTPKNA